MNCNEKETSGKKCKQNKCEKGEKANKIITDPQGSYTGVPIDPYDAPVQDADDL